MPAMRDVLAYDGEFGEDEDVEPFIQPPRVLLWAFVVGCVIGIVFPFPVVL